MTPPPPPPTPNPPSCSTEPSLNKSTLKICSEHVEYNIITINKQRIRVLLLLSDRDYPWFRGHARAKGLTRMHPLRASTTQTEIAFDERTCDNQTPTRRRILSLQMQKGTPHANLPRHKQLSTTASTFVIIVNVNASGLNEKSVEDIT